MIYICVILFILIVGALIMGLGIVVLLKLSDEPGITDLFDDEPLTAEDEGDLPYDKES